MPIPPMPDNYLAQVVFKGKSGQPADVYTNSFFFRNENFGGTHDSVADQLADDLHEFYNAQPTNVVGGVAIASALSSAIINLLYEIRVYDLGDAAPRYPRIRERTLANLSASALPSEVCATLSFVASENQPRSRGRIYLGPLGTSQVTTANGRAVINSSLRIGAMGAALRLMQKPSFSWSVYSRADGMTKEITGAWMDNAWDTQRRRGELPTERHTIGTYMGQSGLETPLAP